LEPIISELYKWGVEFVSWVAVIFAWSILIIERQIALMSDK
jgi:hypothetical protein